MTIYKKIHDIVTAAIDEAVKTGEFTLSTTAPTFVVEPPREAAHGDLATNAAMVLAKAAGKAPRAIAEILKPKLEKHALISGVEIAGPGFINLRLPKQIWQNEIHEILRTGTHYGDSDIGKGTKVIVEYVSVNPTGPMHAGHVRGAVLGDALVRLLRKAGYDVTGEYYFNDAGAQVDVLARTTHLRYREALGENIVDIPQGFYPGEYLKEVGQDLAKPNGLPRSVNSPSTR
jgi:arginyl-tRNA synthetase